MAKITINPVQAGNGLETAINLRLQQIEDTFNDNVLWRSGVGANPNQMNVDLDMNSNDILNLTELTLGAVSVKADIETNQNDIEDLKAAVNTLWLTEPPPFPGGSLVNWGEIGGTLTDQVDLNTRFLSVDSAISAEEVARIAADALKLNLTGGTLTGDLTIDKGFPVIQLKDNILALGGGTLSAYAAGGFNGIGAAGEITANYGDGYLEWDLNGNGGDPDKPYVILGLRDRADTTIGRAILRETGALQLPECAVSDIISPTYVATKEYADTKYSIDGSDTITGPILTSHGGIVSSVAVSPSSPAFDLSTTSTIYGLKDGTSYLDLLDAGGKGLRISEEVGGFSSSSLQIRGVGYTGIFDSLKFKAGGVLGQILFTNDAGTADLGFNVGANSVITSNLTQLNFGGNYGGINLGSFTITAWVPNTPKDLGTTVSRFNNVYTQGDYFSYKADGATAVGFNYDTLSFTTSGAKLASWKNATIEKASIDKDGQFSTTAAAPTAVNHLTRKDYVDGLAGGVRVALGTLSLSGTTQGFITGIPATATRVILLLEGISIASGTGFLGAQLANTSVVNQNGAAGAVSLVATATQAVSAFPANAYYITNTLSTGGAGTGLNGEIILTKRDGANSWFISGNSASLSGPNVFTTAGGGAASSVVDSLRIYTTGAANFAAGSTVYAYYEV